MIVTLLLTILLNIVSAVASVLPVGTLPTQVTSGFSTLIGYMYLVNSFFPVDTLIALTILALALQLIIILWNLGHMVLRYLRGN